MNTLFLQRAIIAVRDCIGVKKNQTVLIIEDSTLSKKIVDAFVNACKVCEAKVMLMVYEPEHYISMKEFGLFSGASKRNNGMCLPVPLIKAIEAADVSIVINSDMELLFDQNFLNLLKQQKTITWLPYLSEDRFLSLLPSTFDQAKELAEITSLVGNKFLNAKNALITSDAGTNIELKLGDYRINWGSGIFKPGFGYGGLEILPGGQISTMPNPNTANGVVVIDRSVNAPEFKELIDPIQFTVEKGYVTRIEGGVEAKRMERFLKSIDENGEAYHITELGVGTNKACKMCGIAGPTEDTHTWGCVSLALGADVHLGGETKGSCHLDMTMRAASLSLDGELIIRDGEIVLGDN